mgnify:CR=1 FL=1
MTLESNYAIAIVSDWLKNLATVFQPIRTKTKTKTNHTLYARYLPRFKGKVTLFNVGSSFSYETGINGSRRCALYPPTSESAPFYVRTDV